MIPDHGVALICKQKYFYFTQLHTVIAFQYASFAPFLSPECCCWVGPGSSRCLSRCGMHRTSQMDS